jgi:hypothetical protein
VDTRKFLAASPRSERATIVDEALKQVYAAYAAVDRRHQLAESR